MATRIEIRGAREHNLQSIDVEIPHGKITVVTGVSGSGKSSLAFDTVFREGQRRYLSALSAHARQFLGRQHRPAADGFRGLPPSLSVDQKTTVRNPRSTVGTLTEIYDHLRLLFARLGTTSGELAPDELADPIGTHTFSFNTPHGACPRCDGLAVRDRVEKDLLVNDPDLTLRQGALVPTTKTGYIVYSQVTVDVLNDVCKAHAFDVDTPWRELTDEQRDVIFFGSKKLVVPFGKHPLESRMRWSGITARPREEGYYKGLIPTIAETLARNRNHNILRFARSVACDECEGTRLGPLGRSVRFHGRGIGELTQMPVRRLRAEIEQWAFEPAEQAIAEPIRVAMLGRLRDLSELGLGYLELARSSTTLSGGEAQRIRLAGQVGSGLQGLLYVLDEPSIGLHPTDGDRLLQILRRLADQGNTILCVEHDANTIVAADHWIELGPGAGRHGGQVLYQGPPTCPPTCPPTAKGGHAQSPTQAWLRRISSWSPRQPRDHDARELRIRGASAHNLRNIDVALPLGLLHVVTGVSGAGKSTLVDHVLARALRRELHGATAEPGAHTAIEGMHQVAKVVHIDASPIGRTPRSNPATYTGVLDPIRDLFAAEPGAVSAGFGKGHFSMNVAADEIGGRCEDCQGAGHIVIGMHGLADVEVECSMCRGRRFQESTLAIRYRSATIADVLAMSVSEALEHFDGVPAIERILRVLQTLGLGYIHLGQSATTLSGGEAQRVKLATELARPPGKGHNVYILDEPTTGLHGADVQVLLEALSGLCDQGHTVIVIEHDPDVIRAADRVLDLGPGSGDEGGRVVFAGTPLELLSCAKSATGRALAALGAEGWPHFESSSSERARHTTSGSAGRPAIRFFGVATNNLQDIDVEIPRGKLTVITGVSGSGKSSLAFDTVFAEGRRRFTENLTTQARRHLPNHTLARFERVEGLTPTIAIRQHRGSASERSTVGTMTRIQDALRLLYSRAGSPRGRTARQFSFNHQEGACPRCGGAGVEALCDPDKLVSHPERSLFDGAMDGHKTGRFYGERDGQYLAILTAVERALNLDLHSPYRDLDRAAREVAMFGTGDREFDVTWIYQRKKRSGEHTFRGKFLGLAKYVDEEYERKKLDRRGEAMRPLLSIHTCADCDGHRLRPRSRAVTLAGLSLGELTSRSVDRLIDWFEEEISGALSADELAIVSQPREDVLGQLRQMTKLGLGYLTLDRSAASLSGGETQRVRLAAQLGTRMTGITYVLDEPTVGLHPHDTTNLLDSLRGLLEEDGTVLVVEHDPQVWSVAEHVIQLGPSAGERGGTIVAEGPPSRVPAPTVAPLRPRELPDAPTIRLVEAHLHNLDSVTVEVPTGALVAVTGVSGSGKTSLALGVLASSIEQGEPVGCRAVEGIPDVLSFDGVVRVDQSPIGTTPQTTPVTYVGVFDRIRRAFAATDAARAMGLKIGAFSTSVKGTSRGGRCEDCQGLGAVRTRMDFLPDVWHPCETCSGRRFSQASLGCTIDGKSIADVLDMTVSESLSFFEESPAIRDTLRQLERVGLGYLALGQAGHTLSGGEAQRLKLARQLDRPTDRPPQGGGGRTLFVFDEPTTGLHARDVERLLPVLRGLTENGHTVLVVEHNLDVIRNADWVLDLGPGGGENGGHLLYSGPPAGLADCADSLTGQYLEADPN